MAKLPGSAKRSSAGTAPAAGRGSFADAAGAVGPDADMESGQESEALPGPEEIAALMAPVAGFAREDRFARIRGALVGLSKRPPQALLLEGGDQADRLAAAHYWALLLNCSALFPSRQGGIADSLSLLPDMADDQGGLCVTGSQAPLEPCLECAECVRMVTHLHRDCLFLDGAAASIKIDDVRGLRALLGEAPRDARQRMVFLREAQALVEAAANALLKSLEEPAPGTSFVLLAPQRERLLPTLVSRSVVLTLPWPDTRGRETADDLIPWEAALCSFLREGRGWFERTGVKGSLDAAMAHGVINLCRRALAARIAALHSNEAPKEGLEQLFALLPPQRLRMLDEVLAECQDSLLYNVNPVLVMEWMATRMYLLLPARRAGAA